MNLDDLVKKCMVCGDRAIGNNFDALSCESCKAFFRRNAVKDKDFKCHFENDCKIDVKTRRFCKRCRLRKCFEIGMKRDWILTEDEKKLRKNRIELNRKKRKISFSSQNTDSTNCSQHSTIDSNSPKSCDNCVTKTNDEISNTFPFDLDINEIDAKILRIEDIFNEENDDISDIVYQKAVELEFSIIPIARPITDYNNNFNELEGNKLTELFSAMTILSEVVRPVTSKAMDCREACRVLYSKCDQDIRKIIKMSKKLTAFNNICENDKMILIKYGCLEMFSIRTFPTYDYKNEHWVLALDNENAVEMNLEVIKPFPRNLYGAYKNFYYKMSKEWDSDPVILDLMTAIVLFNPDRPDLTQKELVKLQQYVYMYLLQRYLLLRYRSEGESKIKFLRLLNTLVDLNILGERHLKNGKEKNPELISPLLREIFGLNLNSNAIESNNTNNILIY